MIRWSTTIVVVLLAAVGAIVSYRHAYEVVTAYGEAGFTAVLVPLTVDGLVYASSMVLLDAARRGAKRPKLAYFTLGLGILATLAANVMHGIGYGPIGAVVAAWPAVALVLSYELLMGLVRRSSSPMVETDEVHVPAVPPQVEPMHDVKPDVPHRLDEAPALEVEVQPERVPETDVDEPFYPLALNHFLSDLTQGEVPPVRTIKERLNVGTDRARRLQTYLGGLVEVSR